MFYYFQTVSNNVGKCSEAACYDCPVEILFGIELGSISDGMRVFVLVSVFLFIPGLCFGYIGTILSGIYFM